MDDVIRKRRKTRERAQSSQKQLRVCSVRRVEHSIHRTALMTAPSLPNAKGTWPQILSPPYPLERLANLSTLAPTSAADPSPPHRHHAGFGLGFSPLSLFRSWLITPLTEGQLLN